MKFNLQNLSGLYGATHNIDKLIADLQSTSFQQETIIWNEIGEQIYQQDDVCLLSYATIFQLIEIYLSKQKLSLQLLTYAAILEMQREENDILPSTWANQYNLAIKKLLSFAAQLPLDKNSCVSFACLLAASNKEFKLAKNIMNS